MLSFLFWMFVSSTSAIADEVLKIAILANSESEADIYAKYITKFESEHTDIRVSVNYFSDARYKAKVRHWLENGTQDVLYWQAGEHRLLSLAKSGLLLDLTTLVEEHPDAKFIARQVKPLITYDNRIVASPLSLYSWGMFYNHNTFSAAQLRLPENYTEFLSTCNRFLEQGTIPLVVAGQNNWPVLSWFTYLTLRIYGLDFYKQFINQTISLDDDRFKLVFEKWKEIIETCSIQAEKKEHYIPVASKSIIKKQFGMMLNGAFINHFIPENELNKIGAISFPQISENIGRYEIAPLDTWIISKNAQNKRAAQKFISFFLTKSILNAFNKELGYQNPFFIEHKSTNLLQRESLEILKNADGLLQYPDRDLPQEYYNEIIKILKSHIDKNVGC